MRSEGIRRYCAAFRLFMPIRSRASGERPQAAMVKIICRDVAEVPEDKECSSIQRYMDGRFQHMYASSQFLRVFHRIPNTAQQYAAFKGGKVSTALMFDVVGRDVFVVNEQIALEKEEIEQFVAYVFRENPSARRVIFPGISPEFGMVSYPNSAILWTSDIFLPLPETVETYLAALGRATRSSLKRYGNKIRRDHPSFQFEAFPSGHANAAEIDALLSMNEARIEKRSQAPDISEREAIFTRELLEKCGFVALIRIDNEIVAGTINFQFGSNFFLHLLSHDSRFDRYGLGTLCCYLSICECIARGGKEYHFLWGQYEYKYRLLGVQRDFVRLTIYRSTIRMLLQSRLYLNPALANICYLVKDWAIRKSLRKDRTNLASILLFDVLNAARNFRRSAVAYWGARAAARKRAVMERQ